MVTAAPNDPASLLRGAWGRLPLAPRPIAIGAGRVLSLWLVGDEVDLRRHAREFMDADVPAPYWAFLWAAGAVLARYLVGPADEVRGKRVVDFGCGSGVIAIAAALAGAREVIAVDRDPSARTATMANALLNGCHITVTDEVPAEWDLLLASDVFYEPAGRDAVLALAALGRPVLLAEADRPGQARPDATPFLREAARTVPDVDQGVETAALYRLGAW